MPSATRRSAKSAAFSAVLYAAGSKPSSRMRLMHVSLAATWAAVASADRNGMLIASLSACSASGQLEQRIGEVGAALVDEDHLALGVESRGHLACDLERTRTARPSGEHHERVGLGVV